MEGSKKFKNIALVQKTIDNILDRSGTIKYKKDGHLSVPGGDWITEVIYDANEVVIGITKVPNKDSIFPSHIHPTQVQYMIVTKGKIGLTLDGGYRVLSVKECASISEGIEHSAKSLEDDSHFVHITVPADKSIKRTDKKFIEEFMHGRDNTGRNDGDDNCTGKSNCTNGEDS